MGVTHQILPLAIFAMNVFAARTDFKCYRRALVFVGASKDPSTPLRSAQGDTERAVKAVALGD